jgi:hypothetical protein
MLPRNATVVLLAASTAAAPPDAFRLFTNGSHIPDSSRDLAKSCAYLKGVAAYLRAAGHAVHLHVGHAPDDDVVYASRASTFVPTGGRYSVLLARLVLRRGVGRVLRPPCLAPTRT